MSVPSESLPIIIIGAGISGLSLACLLEHYQIPFQIYDTLPRSYTQGYSISLRSWAFKPLLDVFGRNEAQLRAATATDALIGGKGDIHNMIRDAQTGDNLMVLRGGEGTYFRCNRSFLRDFFLERISPERVHFEWELCDVISDGDSVTATFENGEVVRGRLLIAADVRSKFLSKTVGPLLLPSNVFAGQRVVRASEFSNDMSGYMEGSNATIAMGEMCIIGFQIGKITHEDVKYSWMYSRAGFHGNSGRESLNPSSASTDEMIAVVDEIRPTLAGPFQRLLAADRIRNDDLYHWPMRSLRVPQQLLNRSIDSNVVFIGDAVHAMPIFAGEGGNHGLLDGVQLAECLRVGVQHNHLKESIQQFYDDAYGRWEKGVDASEKRLSDLHQPIEVWRKLAAVEVSK